MSLSLTNSLLLLTLGMASMRAADPVAYVSPQSSYLTSFDPASGRIQKLTTLGTQFYGPLVISPNGATAYIAGSDIGVISLPSGKQTAPITAVPNPIRLAINLDGSLLYAVNALGSTLFVVSTASGKLVTSVKLHTTYANQIAITPDGSQIYLTGLYGVTVVNGQTYAVTTMIDIQGNFGEVISRDGKTLYVAAQNASYLVYVVDTATNTIRTTIPAGKARQADSIALSPDGATLYVQADQVFVEVSTASNSVIGSIPTTTYEDNSQLAVSSDGTSLYESGAIGSGLTQFDITAGTTNRIAIGGFANSVASAPGSSSLYLVQTFPTVMTEDPITEKVTGGIGPIPGSSVLTISDNGNTVGGVNYASTPTSSESLVSLVDTATNDVKTVSISSVFTYPSLALNKDASLAFTPTSYVPFEIGVIDTAAGTLQQMILVPGLNNLQNGFLAIAPDDSTLYAYAAGGAGTLCSISLTLFQETKCVSIPGNFIGSTRGIAINTDGSRLYLTTVFTSQNGSTSGLTEYDAKSLAVTRTASIGPSASLVENSLVFSPESNSVYVANAVYQNPNPTSGSLTRVDLGTFTVASTQPLSYSPVDVGATADGTSVLVVGSTNGTQLFDGITLAPTGTIPGGMEFSIVVTNH